MGAFVLLLFFVYINENIAATQNELIFPLNIETDISSADHYHYNLPIRKYKEEYYDPFLQDYYSETNPYTKQFLEDHIYNTIPNKDYDILESDRLYSEQPAQSRLYKDYIALQRNSEYLQSRRNDNDFYPQNYPYREMENAEMLKWSDKEDILKDCIHQDIPKMQSNSNIFYGNNKYISHYHGADTPNEISIDNHEFDERLKLCDNSCMQIPVNSEDSLVYITNNSQKDESKGGLKKHNEYAERLPLDTVYNWYTNTGKQRISNIADEQKDKTHLKHSLTSSASAVENRLLTSHIKRTFDKVKGNEDTTKSHLNFTPLLKSQPNEKYMNSFENKFRNSYTDNNFKDIQKIMKQPKKATTDSMPQLNGKLINRANPFDSYNNFDIPLRDSHNNITEIYRPCTNQLFIDASHLNSFKERNMEDVSSNLSKPHMQTTANQNMPSRYDWMKINKKQIEDTQEEHCYEKLNTSPTFGVNDKLINDQPLNWNNHLESYKHSNHGSLLKLQLSDKAPLNSFDIREYLTDQIKPSPIIHNPSNVKPLLLNKTNDNDFNKRTNSDRHFLETDLAKDTVSVKSEKINMKPEYITATINQVPHYYAAKNNLTPNNRNGDRLNEDNKSTVFYKTPELNPSIYETTIVHPYSIPKKDQYNCTKYNIHQPLAELSQPISYLNYNERNYYTGINVPSTPTPQLACNSQSEQSKPLISTEPYTLQATNSSFYEINRPKVTILNPTSVAQKNSQGQQNPIIYHYPSSYQQIECAVNAPKVQILSPNYTTLNPIKSPSLNANGMVNTVYPFLSSVNQYSSKLSTSLNNIASIILTNILSSLNKDITKTLKKPLSQKINESHLPTSTVIPYFEVTHPCIESPRILPDTLIKKTKEDSASTPTNKFSKPCVSSITINVLPPAQQNTNDIIILV